jgi:hypothetical protein
MHIFLYLVITTLINSFIIITMVDIVLMGLFVPVFSKKSNVSNYIVPKEN